MLKKLKIIVRLLRAILKTLLEMSGKGESEITEILDSTERPPDPPVNG